ncbi:MAG TPA: phage/plasmid primase, P4 family [Pirellulales bacterium]|nr:phage/plasmid primase, P4 family [Pirellulales bacterium]
MRFITAAAIAEHLLKESHFARQADGKLFVYLDGYYQPKGDDEVRRLVKSLLKRIKRAAEWSSKLANEVVEFIAIDAPPLREKPHLKWLNVRNGLLNVETRELRRHTPEYRCSVQIPVKYDPSAACPNNEKFVNDVFSPDARHLAWEIIAWLMLPDMSIQMSVLLLGEGENGKSAWLRLIRSFLGRANVSALSLQKIEKDKFAAYRLVGKLANICADLPTEHLDGVSTFKGLTGKYELTAENKFQTSFEFEPFVRLVFSANDPPRAKSANHAFFRRWLVVPFEAVIPDEKRIDRDKLDAMLAAPAELSGVLNKAIDALPDIRRNGAFTTPESCRAALSRFQQSTDPLMVWLESNTLLNASAFVVKTELVEAYNRHAAAKGVTPATAHRMTKAVKLLTNEDHTQKTVNGRVEWVYQGIDMNCPAAKMAA